jgi:hypothetical protein
LAVEQPVREPSNGFDAYVVVLEEEAAEAAGLVVFEAVDDIAGAFCPQSAAEESIRSFIETKK